MVSMYQNFKIKGVECHALDSLFSNRNYSAAGAGHSALGHSAFLQQLSAFWHGVSHAAFAQQLSALGQHFSTVSVFGQHLVAHSLPSFLQQQATAHKATAAINKIFFITLNFKWFILLWYLLGYSIKNYAKLPKNTLDFDNKHQNRCKFTLNIAYMQKKLYFCRRFTIFLTKLWQRRIKKARISHPILDSLFSILCWQQH